MTVEDYVNALERKGCLQGGCRKDEGREEGGGREDEGKMYQGEALTQATKVQHQADAAAQCAFNTRWSAAAMACQSEELHQHIKSGAPPAPSNYTRIFLWWVREI
jgi:hypothetical protein